MAITLRVTEADTQLKVPPLIFIKIKFISADRGWPRTRSVLSPRGQSESVARHGAGADIIVTRGITITRGIWPDLLTHSFVLAHLQLSQNKPRDYEALVITEERRNYFLSTLVNM